MNESKIRDLLVKLENASFSGSPYSLSPEEVKIVLSLFTGIQTVAKFGVSILSKLLRVSP